MGTTPPNTDELVDGLVDEFIAMTVAEQHLVVSAYRLLSAGGPVELDVVARASEWTPADVDARLESWPAAYLDGDGHLVGLWGMAVEPISPHQARIADQAPV